jgi:hypothetical protein
MTIASSVDRQFIRAKIFQFGESFINGEGKRSSFFPLDIAKAYELDYMAVYAELLRMVDADLVRRNKQGRYFWL